MSPTTPMTRSNSLATPVSPRFGLESLVLWLALASGLCNAIAFWWRRETLWEDEIIAMTHGLQPLPGFFVEILRNDIHPFVYFLLLKFWMIPNPGSDKWILASSLVTAFASAAAIAWVAHRCYGPRAALWAAAVYCILPNFAWAAGNLRMYSLIPALVVLVWYAQRRVLRGEAGTAAIGVMMAAELILAYTHAIEIFFVAFMALALLCEQYGTSSARDLRRWFVSQLLCGLCMLPLVVPALVRGTEPLPPSTLDTLMRMPARLFSGWALENDLGALVAGGVVFCVLLVVALSHRGGRVLALVSACGVVLAAWGLGTLGKPMFKSPVFAANVVPFLVLAAAAGIASSQLRLARGAALVGVLILAVATWPWAGRLLADGSFKAAGEFVAGKAKPGDLVVVPGLSTFWGVVRYAVGPTWGKPLEVMPLKDNPQWTKLKERLGPTTVKFLGLDPLTDIVERNGVRYVVGGDARLHKVAPGASLYVVRRERYPEPVLLAFGASAVKSSWIGGDVWVMELRATAGAASVINP